MIIDNLKNIEKYKEISPRVAEFLKTLSKDTPVGHYEIEDGAFANVDVYTTKLHKDCKLEAHKNYIDIQMLLDGVEELDYTAVEGLKVREAYDKNRDVMFFETPQKALDKVVLQENKFAFIYPHEAHQPQMARCGQPQEVKKVVVKIRA